MRVVLVDGIDGFVRFTRDIFILMFYIYDSRIDFIYQVLMF